ncbi:MAG: hypothetical protein QGH14_06305, partial [Candidatus Bathyarchaeota archaeon]|nr:hypothetical protein [Candidatus Bathyarchaeota archaeon]
MNVSSPEESVAFITLDEASGFGFFLSCGHHHLNDKHGSLTTVLFNGLECIELDLDYVGPT